MKTIWRNLIILLLWLFLWQLLDWYIDMDMLVAGPINTLQALQRLVGEESFWSTIWYSLKRIVEGFLLAFLCGILLGAISFRIHFIKEFFLPAIHFMRSVPVASFIVLALLWVGSQNLSILISFVIAFPVIYEGVISGLEQADKKLLEMSQIFCMRKMEKACTVYWYRLFPVLCVSVKNAMGMAWKAGVAAEVIGVPINSLGERLYYAKIYLETGELFAWTLVIMMCSTVTTVVIVQILFLLDKLMKKVVGIKRGRIIEPVWVEDLILKVTDLEKSYGELQVLKKISLSISTGNIVAIMGESGKGKTTLLRILAELEPLDSGSIEYKGKVISMAFQENRLLEPLTAWQNCCVSGKRIAGKNKEEVKTILEEILPKECQKQSVSHFSGGMKRRTAVARAMLAYSNLVILDEPFSGLDEENRKKMINFIRKYQMGRTIVFTTHREEDVVEMGAGKVVLS